MSAAVSVTISGGGRSLVYKTGAVLVAFGLGIDAVCLDRNGSSTGSHGSDPSPHRAVPHDAGKGGHYSPPAWFTALNTAFALSRLALSPLYRTPLTARSSAASSRSITVIVALSATPKAAP